MRSITTQHASHAACCIARMKAELHCTQNALTNGLVQDLTTQAKVILHAATCTAKLNLDFHRIEDPLVGAVMQACCNGSRVHCTQDALADAVVQDCCPQSQLTW